MREDLDSIDDPAEHIVVELLGLPEAEQARALEQALAQHPDLADDVRSRCKPWGSRPLDPRPSPTSSATFA